MRLVAMTGLYIRHHPGQAGQEKRDSLSSNSLQVLNDKGIYIYPTQPKKKRGVGHPTRKNIKMFMELIEKHSNPGELVVDTFLGSGTTAIACKKTNRKFKGCEISKEYYDKPYEEIHGCLSCYVSRR